MVDRRPYAKNLLSDQRGQTTIEFALILPLLLVLLLGVVDFAKAFNYWNDANQIAGEGARLASVNRNPGTGTLQSYLAGQGDTRELRGGSTPTVPTGARVCISFPNATSNVGDPVRVTVTVGYAWLPFLRHNTPITSVTLSGSATMRLESAPTTFSAGCTS